MDTCMHDYQEIETVVVKAELSAAFVTSDEIKAFLNVARWACIIYVLFLVCFTRHCSHWFLFETKDSILFSSFALSRSFIRTEETQRLKHIIMIDDIIPKEIIRQDRKLPEEKKSNHFPRVSAQ